MNDDIRAALAKARRWPHGSRLHGDAMTVLYRAYWAAHGRDCTYNELWDWLDKLEAEDKK